MGERTLQAVLDEDLVNLLKSVGQLEKIETATVFCSQCGVLITLDNLQLIIPSSKNEFEFVCNDFKCVEKFYETWKK
jgi:hypothetical protein